MQGKSNPSSNITLIFPADSRSNVSRRNFHLFSSSVISLNFNSVFGKGRKAVSSNCLSFLWSKSSSCKLNLTVQCCCDKYCEKTLSAKIQRVNSTWRKTYWRRRVLAQGRLLLTKVRLRSSSFDLSKCWPNVVLF
jgi:hypothetical protein